MSYHAVCVLRSLPRSGYMYLGTSTCAHLYDDARDVDEHRDIVEPTTRRVHGHLEAAAHRHRSQLDTQICALHVIRVFGCLVDAT